MTNQKKQQLSIFCMLFLAGSGLGLTPHQDDDLDIITLNVGQADATLFHANGTTLLLDTGAPLEEAGRLGYRLLPVLEKLTGKRHLDYVLITHFHADHIGSPGRMRSRKPKPAGLFQLVNQLGVTIGTVLERGSWNLSTPTTTETHYRRHLNHWLKNEQVKSVRIVNSGDSITLGRSTKIRIISASGNGYLDKLARAFPDLKNEYPPSENDYSVSVKVEHGDFELFAGGDLSGQNVLRRFGPVGISYVDMESHIADRIGDVEVYRVNHHGSKNSSNPCFLEKIRPEVSLISSGNHNRYDHPDVDVFFRLKNFGDVFITGGAGKSMQAFPRSLDQAVIGDDIWIKVQKGASSFLVNGLPYPIKKESDEIQPSAIPCHDLELKRFTTEILTDPRPHD